MSDSEHLQTDTGIQFSPEMDDYILRRDAEYERRLKLKKLRNQVLAISIPTILVMSIVWVVTRTSPYQGKWAYREFFQLELKRSGDWNLGYEKNQSRIQESGTQWFVKNGVLHLTNRNTSRQVTVGLTSHVEQVASVGYELNCSLRESKLVLVDSVRSIDLSKYESN